MYKRLLGMVLRRLQKDILVASGFHKDVSLDAVPVWCLENKDAIRLQDPKYLAKSQIIKTHVFEYVGRKGAIEKVRRVWQFLNVRVVTRIRTSSNLSGVVTSVIVIKLLAQKAGVASIAGGLKDAQSMIYGPITKRRFQTECQAQHVDEFPIAAT